MNTATDCKHTYTYSLIRAWEVYAKTKAVCCHLAFLFPSSGISPIVLQKDII